MPVLEAAAIGAAAYGTYKGGQAAAKKTKERIKEFGRQRNRADQQRSLNRKSEDRKSRIASIQSMRANFKSTGTPSASASSLSTSSSSRR